MSKPSYRALVRTRIRAATQLPSVVAAIIELMLGGDVAPGDDVLDGFDLTSLLLSGADFRHKQLRGADFSFSCLRGAVFAGADATGANFTGADLTGANMESTDLTRAILTDSTCLGANFDHATLTGAICIRAFFIKSSMLGAARSDVDWSGADLTAARLLGDDGERIALQWNATVDATTDVALSAYVKRQLVERLSKRLKIDSHT